MMRTEEIHEMITSEFPANPFYGVVTEKWHPPSFYESEGDDLTTLLKGKTWRDLDPDYVDVNRDDYVLMNTSALPVYFAAGCGELRRILVGRIRSEAPSYFILRRLVMNYGGVLLGRSINANGK